MSKQKMKSIGHLYDKAVGLWHSEFVTDADQEKLRPFEGKDELSKSDYKTFLSVLQDVEIEQQRRADKVYVEMVVQMNQTASQLKNTNEALRFILKHFDEKHAGVHTATLSLIDDMDKASKALSDMADKARYDPLSLLSPPKPVRKNQNESFEDFSDIPF